MFRREMACLHKKSTKVLVARRELNRTPAVESQADVQNWAEFINSPRGKGENLFWKYTRARTRKGHLPSVISSETGDLIFRPIEVKNKLERSWIRRFEDLRAPRSGRQISTKTTNLVKNLSVNVIKLEIPRNLNKEITHEKGKAMSMQLKSS